MAFKLVCAHTSPPTAVRAMPCLRPGCQCGRQGLPDRQPGQQDVGAGSASPGRAKRRLQRVLYLCPAITHNLSRHWHIKSMQHARFPFRCEWPPPLLAFVATNLRTTDFSHLSCDRNGIFLAASKIVFCQVLSKNNFRWDILSYFCGGG